MLRVAMKPVLCPGRGIEPLIHHSQTLEIRGGYTFCSALGSGPTLYQNKPARCIGKALK